MYNKKQKTKKSMKRNNTNKVKKNKKNKKNKKTKKVYSGGKSLFKSGQEIPALKDLCVQLFENKKYAYQTFKKTYIHLNFITENIKDGIFKYPTLSKSSNSIPDYVYYKPVKRHILLITEMYENVTTYYILTFEVGQFDDIIKFKNTIEQYQKEIQSKEKNLLGVSYNDIINSVVINLNEYKNYPIFKNVFVTDDFLTFKKDSIYIKTKVIKLMNLYKCSFIKGKFINNLYLNKNKVNLILKDITNNTKSGTTSTYLILTKKLLNEIINDNKETEKLRNNNNATSDSLVDDNLITEHHINHIIDSTIINGFKLKLSRRNNYNDHYIFTNIKIYILNNDNTVKEYVPTTAFFDPNDDSSNEDNSNEDSNDDLNKDSNEDSNDDNSNEDSNEDLNKVKIKTESQEF